MSVLNRLVKACCLYKAALGYGCLGLAIIGGFSSALTLTQCFPFQWIPEFTSECSPEWTGMKFHCNLFLYLLCIIVYLFGMDNKQCFFVHQTLPLSSSHHHHHGHHHWHKNRTLKETLGPTVVPKLLFCRL